MSSAQTLLAELFDCLSKIDTSVDRCAELFADDGVFELPYFPTIGMPPRFEGKAAVRVAFALIASHFSGFTLSHIQVHEMKDAGSLFVEYHSEGFIDGGARVYAQDYASLLVVENGRIKLLREYLNVIATARMLLPGGLAGVPAQED